MPDSAVDHDLSALSELMHSRDPYALLARIRERSPYTPRDGLVVVGRYEHCSRLLRDPRISSARDRARIHHRSGSLSRNFLNLDPPDHTRLRRLVAKAFTPAVVGRLEPLIRSETDALMEAAAGQGRFDVVTDLASPLPMSVICGLLGVPSGDRQMLLRWSDPLSRQLDVNLCVPELRPSAQVARASARAGADYIGYFRELIRFRRTAPADDLISELIAVEAGSDQLTESELIATCILLVSGGHETSVNLISNGALVLLDLPRQRTLLAEQPDRASALVEEVLRTEAPIQFTTRVAAADLDLDGFPVAAGDLILMLLGAANRDPCSFPAPDVFDPDRDRPTAHLSFAVGAHFCLGASLARLEAAVAFEAFATRLIRPRMEAGGLSYKPTLSLRGLEHLPVTVEGVRGRRT